MRMASTKGFNVLKVLLLIGIVIIQMLVVIPATVNIHVCGDMVFTYTLANNAYSPPWFVQEIIDDIPNTNGWFDSTVLKEWYQVSEYNKFDYSSVYWHQRLDVHPLLYYMLVHTICSFFPGTYSNMYAGIVNILGILIIDLLLILLFKAIYNECVYAVLPMSLLMLQEGFVTQIFNLRMYILLAAVCLWYLYIHISGEIYGWNRKRIIVFALGVVVGCQTHNYFYVYAFSVSFIQIIRFIQQKKLYSLINYAMAGMTGLMLNLVIFPWMIWQVIFNQQNKHTELTVWNANSIRELMVFLDEYWFSMRGLLILFVLSVSCIFAYLYRKSMNNKLDLSHGYIWILVVCSTMLYLLIIFTLDGGKRHYNIPEYIPVIILLSSIILWIVMSFVRDSRVVLPIMLIAGIILMGDYSKWQYEYYSSIHHADVEWAQIADDYSECDCMCIGMDEIHVMDYSFYEVAQYDEVKVVDAIDYNPSNIDDQLEGRKTDSSGVIAYISEKLEMPDNAILLSTCNEMNCVYLEYREDENG